MSGSNFVLRAGSWPPSRSCGSCSYVHSSASEALVAFGLAIYPPEAKLIAGGVAAVALVVLAGSVAALVLVLDQLA